MHKVNNSTFPAILVIMFIFIIVSVSCEVGTTKIADINNHPRDYAGKEVTISGEVTETFSLFVVKYFVVRDNSGEISVVTERPIPAKGEKIRVKGSVKEAFSLGTQTALVLLEAPEKSK